MGFNSAFKGLRELKIDKNKKNYHGYLKSGSDTEMTNEIGTQS